MRTWMAMSTPTCSRRSTELPAGAARAPALRRGPVRLPVGGARALPRRSDVDTFYNSDEAWAPTEEAYGPGVEGQRIDLACALHVCRLPGEHRGALHHHPLVQAAPPAGRGIGFSGWLAVDSEPERLRAD